MGEVSKSGDIGICPSCLWRNKAGHQFCVRCSASMDAAISPRPMASGAGTARTKRFLLAAGVIAAIGVGLVVRTVFRATLEVPPISEDVRADSARAVSAPPPVSGWSPGANVPDAAYTAPSRSSGAAPGWSSESFPVSVPAPVAANSPDVAMTSAAPQAAPIAVNPSDVPGDPAASMVGIAPRAPRQRAGLAGQRVFTEQDLLATRGEEKRVP